MTEMNGIGQPAKDMPRDEAAVHHARSQHRFGRSEVGVVGQRNATHWLLGIRVALLSAVLFLLAATITALADLGSVGGHLIAPTIYLVGGLLAAILLMAGGGVLAAFAWYVLGTALYFGGGTIVGAFFPSPQTMHSIAESLLVRDLLRANLLNASSVMIVLAVSSPWAIIAFRRNDVSAASPARPWHHLVRWYPAIVVFAICALALRAVVFPLASNLVLRSAVGIGQLIVLLALFLMGFTWRNQPLHWRGLGVFALSLALALSVLEFSKMAIIMAILPVILGALVRRPSLLRIVGGFAIVGATYLVAVGFVPSGRAHTLYDPIENTIAQRSVIALDVLSGMERLDDEDSAAKAGSARLATLFIQGYLIEEYDEGRRGTSLADFWVAVIPRVLWEDKPNVTRFGRELHGEFWLDPDPQSALAPTYTAEAYWNFGVLGLVLVSVLIGAEIAWATRCWGRTLQGEDPVFLAVAVPMALLFGFVETWIAPSYIGGFAALFLIWFALRWGFREWRDDGRRGHSRGAANR
jgi:hypothetical protein